MGSRARRSSTSLTTPRSADCNPSGPPSSSSAAAIPAKANAVNHAVNNPGGYQATVPSLSARANDSYLTSKVKTRFIDQQKFNVVHVKVVTEANVVYLLGLVKHKEADDATQIARTTGGVQKVVRLFEYLD